MPEFKTFTSKMDSELKKECQIYCIREEIDLIELIDKALRHEIGYVKKTTEDDQKIFEKE
jgi:hypothetical protein